MAKLNISDLNLTYARCYMRLSIGERHRAYRKFEGMLNMGESLTRVLERFWLHASHGGKKTGHPLAVLARDWIEKNKKGRSLSECLEGCVPERDLMLIRAGEESGSLASALGSIQTLDVAARGMKQAITRAMAYPVVLFFMLAGVMWAFGIVLIDPLRQIAPPHVLEQLSGLALVSDFIRQYGIITLAVVMAAVIFIIIGMPNWDGKWRVRFDRHPPYSWYRIAQGSGFLLALSALLRAQVSLVRCFELLEKGRKPWFQRRMRETRYRVLKGENLGQALLGTGLEFPDEPIARDLEILAERGDVSQVMEAITKEWLDDQTQKLTIQANVVRTIGMALVAMVIAWAMLSIIGITQQVQKGGI